jgi:uncharacterized protein YdhG (YjbR/CyaY superfamily)
VGTKARYGTSAGTPEAYIEALPEPRRSQVRELHELIRKSAPDLAPYIQSGMLGYGTYRYRSASGREGDWCRVGLASNKATISLHVLMADESGRLEAYKDRLPKADVGRSCVRFKRLEDVDVGVLEELIRKSAESLPPGAIEG